MNKQIVGVDWITATWSDHQHYEEMLSMLRFEHVLALKNGKPAKASYRNNYHGLSTESTFIGKREDGMMVQISGHLADRFFSPIVRSCEHIARLDLQVTVKPEETPQEALERAYDDACAAPRGKGKVLQIKYMGSKRGKETVYLGSPASEQRGRIYDKEEESGDPSYKGMVRFEVQLRNDRAMAAAQYIQRCSSHLSGVVEVVNMWYTSKGVSIPQLSAGECSPPLAVKSRGGYDATLAWLASQVSPVLLRLLAELGTDTTLKALFFAFRECPTYELEIALCVKHLGM